MRRALPFTELVLDWPCVYEDGELRDLVGSSALNYGLGNAGRDRAAYFGDRTSLDHILMLERPGLYSATANWHLIRGSGWQSPESSRDPQQQRIAAWLELTFWWRQLFAICTGPGLREADMCIKCTAELARIWLWLAHGEWMAGRAEVLRRALEVMPEERDVLRRTLELWAELPRSLDSPLAETLPALVRISARIAALIDAEATAAGSSDVKLAGGNPAELVPPGGAWKPTGPLACEADPLLLPLTDWRALACPLAPDDSFALIRADLREPAVLRAAASSREGPYPTWRADGVMIRPGSPYLRTRLRAIQCRTTDPVSFALADGQSVAGFPNLRGWSAADMAERAVAEHRAWLRSRGASAGDGSSASARRELALLLTAARAALFYETVANGDPLLSLTVTETGRALAARSTSARSIAEEAVGRYGESTLRSAEPPRKIVSSMRKLVLGLAPYAAG
jgi:hypothetical protein